ncbi:MAG: HEAT repeat domain-containing protein [Planctomycetota bacterium]|jgi:HEAT repeat protein
MSGRKLLPVIGLLLLSGIAAWLLSQPAVTAPALLPPAPHWAPLQPILNELTTREPSHRIEGGRHANDTGDPALEEPLLQALRAAEAAWADGRRPTAQREAERRVRITLAAALCRMEGPRGEHHTRAFLLDADPLVRRAAILTAGRRGLTPAPEVMRKLLADAHPEVQVEAALAAARVRPAGVVEALIAGAAGGPAAPRMLLALGHAGGDEAAAAIATALRDPARTIPAGEAAVVLGAPLVPALQEAMRADSEQVRRVAADALRRIGGAALVPAMLRALTDDSVHVRRFASELLAAHATAGHRAELLAALAATTDGAVIRDLGRALQRVAEPPDAAAIAAVARSAPKGAIAALMAALGRCGGTEALAAISDLAARNTDETARGLAEAGAVRFDPALVPAITPLFDHGHYTVQIAAVRAAARAGREAPEAWRAACERLIASKVEPVRLEAAGVLAAADPQRAADAVLRYAAAADPQTAAGAWQCLSRLAGPPGHAAVRAALAKGVSDDVAARFGAEAAVALQLPDAGPLVAALLQRGPHAPPLDKPGRHAAARALGRIGRREQAGALVPLLAADDLTLRPVAAEALFRLLGASDADFEHAALMPVRLPYWARRWWQDNAGKPPSAWSAPRIPRVPTL